MIVARPMRSRAASIPPKRRSVFFFAANAVVAKAVVCVVALFVAVVATTTDACDSSAARSSTTMIMTRARTLERSTAESAFALDVRGLILPPPPYKKISSFLSCRRKPGVSGGFGLGVGFRLSLTGIGTSGDAVVGRMPSLCLFGPRFNIKGFVGTSDDDDDDCNGSVAADVARSSQSPNPPSHRRRRFLNGLATSTVSAAFAIATTTWAAAAAVAADADAEYAAATDTEAVYFRSGAYGRDEYTNSIVASRDTNISPSEVYDSIRDRYALYPIAEIDRRLGVQQTRTSSSSSSSSTKKTKVTILPRALDVGAGAGVSTQVLWEMGYGYIDAVDWSGAAWERFVVDDPKGHCPEDRVHFYEMDDERYLEMWREKGLEKFDVIVFNFAVNESKAKQYARELLYPLNGRLLAPVNTQNDYWLKQAYKAYDAQGNVLWSANDVGAWSVLFQPDVTQDTCQGIWCPPFNGFQKKR